MNFDFNEREQRFFSHLEQQIDQFLSNGDVEYRDTEESMTRMRKGLEALAEIGYFEFEDECNSGSPALMRAMEILSARSPSLFLAAEMSARLFGRLISRWGSDTLRELILPALCKGKLLGAVALSEAAMNVENDPLTTTGLIDGSELVLNGYKNYVVNGADADWVAVIGNMQDRYAIFLVAKGNPGMHIEKHVPTTGYKGVSFSSIDFKNCRIPKANIIEPDNSDALLKTLKLWENQILIGASLGMMTAAFSSAKTHANNHHSGAKPIIAYQAVAFKLAEMLTLIQTSQLLAYRAAWACGHSHGGSHDLTLCAKVFCSEAAEKVASQALQILSGQGFFTGNRAEYAFRCTRYGQIAGTSSEIARVKIGDAVLGYRNRN